MADLMTARRSGRFVRLLAIAVALMTAVVLGVAPIPAYAVSLPCYDTGTFPSERCTVGYQAYPYGQTTGLRSSMQGWPDLGITGTQQAGTDEIRIHLKVWDLNTDGYRARVWIDVFRGCWCTDAVNHVPTTQGAEGGSQGATRVFDSGSSSGNFREWYYTNPDGSVETYLVRLRLGRFQLSTGRYEWGEEQLYRMRVYRL